MSAREVFHIAATRLPWTVGREQLHQYFSRFGQVKSSLVVFDEVTGFSKGFGFVAFEDGKVSTQKALAEENHVIDGRKVEVLARTPGKSQQNTRVNIQDILEKTNL